MDQGDGASAPYSQLDADGAIEATLRDAPPHMQIIYNLLKASHDSNAASLADNSRVMADTTRTLNNLVTRVDELTTRVDVIQQNQHALNARLNDISRANDANQAAMSLRLLEDLREIIVRGIPQAVQLEPMPLSAALLAALNLPYHAPLVVGWRAWSPPGSPHRCRNGCICCAPARRSAACSRLHACLSGCARRHPPKDAWPQGSYLRHFRCWW